MKIANVTLQNPQETLFYPKAAPEYEVSAEPAQFYELKHEMEICKFVALRDLLSQQGKLLLTPYIVEDYQRMGTRLFIAENNGGGFGINPNGELISVFSLKGFHLGRRIVEEAVLRGAKLVECFDGKLPELYAKFGFKEFFRISWSDAQAPKGWDYAAKGRPDVVWLKRI